MLRLSFLGLALAVMCLCSCSPRAPKPGHALVQIHTDNIRSDRVGSPHFVGHNGEKLGRKPKHLQLAPGRHEIGIRYQLMGHPVRDTTLSFEAEAGCSYEVRFDLYPVFRDKAPGGEGDLLSRKIASQGDLPSTLVGMLTLPFEIFSRVAGSGVHNMSGNFKDVESATIDVISSKLDEGIVLRVKVPE